MAGRNLGEAFVVISPDASQFLADLSAKVSAAVKSYKAPAINVPVSADTKPALAQLAGLAAQAKTLYDTLTKLRADVSTTAGQAALARLQAQVLATAKQLNSLKANVDASGLASVEAKLLSAAAAAQRFNQALSGPVLGPATAQLAALQAQAAKLSETLNSIRIDPDDADAVAKLAALQLQAMKLSAALSDISIGADPVKLQAAAAGIAALSRDTATLSDTGGTLAGVWAAVNSRLALTPSWTAPTIAGFSGLHLVADALIEVLIVTVSSLLALGAGAAVAWPAIDQVAYATKNSLNAMSALGVDSGPLAGKLDAVQKAMAPQVIEAYGGALSLVSGQQGVLTRTGTQVVTMFDNAIARVDLWSQSQKSMGGLLQSGVGFLSQLAKILGTVAMAIDNLLTKDPGIARMLLQIVQLVASAINWFSQLPAPIVEATLAIHGIYLWGTVLLGVLLKMGGAAVSAAKGLAALAVNPVAWAVGAAAALAYLAYEGTQADSSTKGLIAQQEAALNAMTASQAATTGLAMAMGALSLQQETLTTGQIESSWHGLSGIIQETGDKANYFGHELGQVTQGSTLHELGAIGDIIHGVFAPGFAAAGAATQQYQHDISSLNAELNKLTGSYGNLYTETGNLLRSGYSLQQAFGLMDAAGVKWNDSLALMEQKVTNLIRGYQDMSIQGGILANSVNALNFQTEQQDSKVTQLNSAWDTFFKTVSGGATGFNAFATQSEGLYASMAAGADTLRVSSGRATISLTATTAAAQKGAPSISGLTTADLQLRDSFVQTATAANTQLDNLTLMASAAGLGAKGTAMLTQASKDMVAQMLPAAKGSQEMTAILYTLAQRGGYQGADSFQALAKWVGNTKDPMTQLDKITSQLTVDSANLAKDVQNLSVALGTTLNDAMATAILNAGGGQKVFDNFAKSVLTTGVNSKSTTQAGVALAQQLFDLTGNTKDAQSEFEAFAQKGLNLTAAQADALWKKVSTQLNPALQVVGTKTVPDAKNAFVDWANNSLKLSTTQSDNLWTELTAKLGPQLQTLTSKTVPAVHQVFVNWAEQSLHLTQTQAETLYQQTLPALQKEINSLQGKAVTVSVSVTGSGGEYIVSSTGAKGQVNVYPVKAAAEGWRVPGFGGGDQVHALLEPGEAVVDKYRTRQYAGLLGAMGVPGFAAGGLVTDFPGAQGTLGDTAQPYFSQLNASMLAQALTAVNKQVKQSLAQILAAGGVYLGPGSGNYAADITTVLKQLGMPLSLVTNWLAQIQTESGGNLNAVNLTDSNAQAGHPSVGLLQLIPSTFASFAGPYRNTPPLVNYGGGTVSEDPMAQIYAAIRYADIRYGGAPGMAAAIGHGHGYAAGGLVTAQAAEQAAYGRLAAGTKAALTKPDAYLKSHLKSVTGELVTLTARQAAEQVAYAAGNLSKFGTALRAELKVSQDKYLSTAEPALTGSLDAALNALLSGSSGGSSGGSSSGSSGAYRPISQDDANLLLQQAAMRPFIMSGGKYVPETLTKTGRQDYASLAEWDWLHGIAPPAKTVAAAAKPGTGGASRLLASGLTPAQYQADLKAVSGLPASAINASPHLRHIWHLLHLQHLADLAGNPYGMSRGGMVFDSGGTLAPGANLVWNRTGQPEHLTPDTGRAGTGGRHASLDDVHAALLELIGVSRQQGSRFAGAVNSSSASAAVRGSYTTRR